MRNKFINKYMVLGAIIAVLSMIVIQKEVNKILTSQEYVKVTGKISSIKAVPARTLGSEFDHPHKIEVSYSFFHNNSEYVGSNYYCNNEYIGSYKDAKSIVDLLSSETIVKVNLNPLNTNENCIVNKKHSPIQLMILFVLPLLSAPLLIVGYFKGKSKK